MHCLWERRTHGPGLLQWFFVVTIALNIILENAKMKVSPLRKFFWSFCCREHCRRNNCDSTFAPCCWILGSIANRMICQIHGNWAGKWYAKNALLFLSSLLILLVLRRKRKVRLRVSGRVYDPLTNEPVAFAVFYFLGQLREKHWHWRQLFHRNNGECRQPAGVTFIGYLPATLPVQKTQNTGWSTLLFARINLICRKSW